MNTSDATIHTDTFKTNQTNYIRNSTYFFLNPSFWNQAFMSITTQSRAENPCLQIKTSFWKILTRNYTVYAMFTIILLKHISVYH